MIKPEAEPLSASQQEYRLACRGCLPTCPHYQVCDGKPWRMEAEVVRATN